MKSKYSFLEMKQQTEKIAMVTAYDYPSARQAEQAGADMILVGDSLGMVVLGYESTIKVTMEDMMHHGKAVSRGASTVYKVVDMPFMSYHVSSEETLRNATRLYQETGCQALKLEGGSSETIRSVEKLTEGGIPVVGHLGLTPQSVNVLGGYKVQGKDKNSAGKLLNEALKIEAAGAVALVLECVPRQLAAMITSRLHIPVIGIGAGIDCDGQVLVYHDLLAYGTSRLPKFAKSYLNSDQIMGDALASFVKEVKSLQFPTLEHTYTMDENNLPRVEQE